jgi:hypothetical protein
MPPPKPYVLPVEKRSALDHLGRRAEGVISPELAQILGCRAGPVRLLNGVQGHTGGFGFAHIESYRSRVLQIQSMGFRGVHDYVLHILSETAFAGLQENGRICLISEKGQSFNYLICQWDAEVSLWSVTTVIPKRHMRDVNVLWRREKAW